jgi:phenylacetic acid degradation operon negative regulatory protein
MPLCPSVAALLDRFHALKPVRAWSLIITLYGDAVVPRGGRLWLGSLTEIMDLFGIDAGHVRTAMSRLTTDGWLERRRIGRNSYYRLSSREEGVFAAATRRIYHGEVRDFDGHLRLALLGPGTDDRSQVRPLLDQAGFALLSPMVYIGLADPPPPLAEQMSVFFVTALPGSSETRMAATAWKLAPIATAYEAFVQRFSPVEAVLSTGETPAPADALVARTLLIHEFRRVVLRDPALPPSLLPPDWPGRTARALAAQIYGRLVPASETYLDTVARNEDGRLPPPQPSFATRFEGTPAWDRQALAL